jgi:hypothetical protein
VDFCAPLCVNRWWLDDIPLDLEVVELARTVLECIELTVGPCWVGHVSPMWLCPDASFDGQGLFSKP